MQQTTLEKLQQEQKQFEENRKNDSIPVLNKEMVENKLYSFTIDAEREWTEYIVEDEKKEMKILKFIPIIHDGIKKVFRQSKNSPIYHEIRKSYLDGKKIFMVSTEGQSLTKRYKVFVQ